MSEMEENLGRQESNEMNAFERQLMQALRPVNPPETLARSLAIAAKAEEQRRLRDKRWLWWKPTGGGLLLMLRRPFPLWAGGALAAMVVMSVFVGQQAHVRHERMQADREFSISLQIEERAMVHTRQQLVKVGVPLD